jgi:dienelactone hydrolase
MLPDLEIQPSEALVDAPVSIRLKGLLAEQQVTLRAQMADYLGCTWASQATFVADRQGCVDVANQRPVAGTYEQPDPMGLFWSMTPVPGAEPQGYASASVAPMHVEFAAEVNGSTIASLTIGRRLMAADVSRTEVRDDGLVGTLFRPPGSGPHPTVITVGGSSGGIWESPAALLASHGFVTLALAYFGIAPLPPGLAEIPLEYFGKAIDWLQRQEGVRPESLAVLGPSRGGELALLLGATFPEIRAVVAYVPSGALWMGIQVGDTAPAEPVPAWTFNGRPLPFMTCGIAADAIDWTRQPIALSPGYVAALRDREIVEHATIPVEKTHGPILMISGQADRMSSPKLAEIAVRRAQQYNFAFPLEHLSYPDAGHMLANLPYLPTTVRHSRHPVRGVNVDFGGTSPGDAFARSDSWPKVLSFLQKNLGQQRGGKISGQMAGRGLAIIEAVKFDRRRWIADFASGGFSRYRSRQGWPHRSS